jgi:hypothetical protein
MSNLASHTVYPAVWAFVYDPTAADPRTYGNVKQALTFLPRTETPFAQCTSDSIIIYADGNTKFVFQFFSQWLILPTWFMVRA